MWALAVITLVKTWHHKLNAFLALISYFWMSWKLVLFMATRSSQNVEIKGTSWTLLKVANISPKKLVHRYLQNTNSNLQTSISPWSRPRSTTLFWAFFLDMVYIFIVQKIGPERDRLQLFCTFAVILVKFSAPMSFNFFLCKIWVITNSKSAANITSWVYWMRNRSLLLKTFCNLFNQLAILTCSALTLLVDHQRLKYSFPDRASLGKALTGIDLLTWKRRPRLIDWLASVKMPGGRLPCCSFQLQEYQMDIGRCRFDIYKPRSVLPPAHSWNKCTGD